MTRVLTRTAVAVTTTAAAITLLASPASAWVGGSFTGANSGPVTFQSSPLSVGCSASSLSGSVTPAGALSVGSTFNGCFTLYGSPATVTASALPWSGTLSGGSISITGYTVTISTGSLFCGYKATLSGFYFGTASPVTAVFSNKTLTQSSGSSACPPTITFNATYTLTGPGL